MSNQIDFKRNKLNSAILSAIAATAVSVPANAQIEEITVTATKRAESTQDIPVSVSALQGDDLSELRISTFEDYVKYLPNVVSMGTGPGQHELYIRGAATEQSKNTISTIQGSSPAVALYLDEQPVAFGGKNLDVYATDLNRIEVLPGPQGTLFGASSQSGTVRLITNKPAMGEFQGGVKADISTTKGGDLSNSQEFYLNVPVTDELAVRVVGYHDHQAGWIDNISNLNASGNPIPGGFTPSVAVLNRADISGYPVHPDSPFEAADNSALVEDDFNDAKYIGGRVSLAYEPTEDWGLLVQHTQQSLDTDGVFAYDPNLDGQSSTTRFEPDNNEDEFGLTSLTINGRIGMLDFIYAVGYLDREMEAAIDYSDYTNGGGYQVYYLCAGTRDFSGSGFVGVDPGGTVGLSSCNDPDAAYRDKNESTRFTQEFRVSMPEEYRARVTAGVFFDKQTTHGSSAFEDAATGEDGDGAWPVLRMVPDVVEGTNLTAEDREFVGDASFVNDYTRKTDQLALFGHLEVDVLPNVTVGFGARWYDIDFDFKGASTFSFRCKFRPDGCDNSDQYPERSAFPNVPRGSDLLGPTLATGGNNVTARLRALGTGTREAFELAGLSGTGGGGRFANPSSAIDSLLADIESGRLNVDNLNDDGVLNASDVIFRASLDWRVTEDILLFITFGQGFRPPVTNRNAGQRSSNQTGPYENYRVPAIALTDELDNYELGMKADFLDNTLRVNSTLYFSDITDLQTSRFDPSNVAFLVFIENVGDAEVLGFDTDFIWMPTPNLTFAGAFSIVDSKITRLNDQLKEISVPRGSELPFTPDFSGNLRARYDFDLALMGGSNAYLSGGISYTGESKSGIAGSAYYIESTTELSHGGRGSGLKIADEGGNFLGGTCGTYAVPETCKNGRYVQDDYFLLDMAVGIEQANWGAELFVNNVTNERAELHVDTLQFVPKVVTNRPRTFGVRFSYDY